MKAIQMLGGRMLGGMGRRGAGLLRALAGLPAGARRTRRGTVLVLVLGALALIAVLTVVYVAVGQSDRRVGATTRQGEEVHIAVQKFADYIAEMIGNAAVATAVDGPQGTGASQAPILYHPFMDYPWTDPYRRSISTTPRWSLTPGSVFEERFSPTGSYDDLWTGTGADAIDRRMPCTPWLSFTLPSEDAAAPNPDDPSRWDHISNFAPDGRFVNLWNLAPVMGTGNTAVRRSAWDAKSGFTPGAVLDPVINAAGTDLDAWLSFGLMVLDGNGNPTTTLPDGGTADPNVPANWSTHQRQLFRPAQGPMFYPANATDGPPGFASFATNDPRNPWYAPYQFVDTDGDGFFDARWFELVDASDFENIRSLLPRDDRYRWFAAAKAVDLNSLVNVNTAMDFKHPHRLSATAQGALPAGSTWVKPMGMGPSLDLLRLLKMVDADMLPLPASGVTTPPGYSTLMQPTGAAATGAEDYSQYDEAAAISVGAMAYDSLRYILSPNSVEVPDPNSFTPPSGFVSADARERYYAAVGSRVSGWYVDGVGGAPGNIQVGARFGMSEFLELFTFRTQNNPQSVSRLEQVLDGRDTSTMDFGPLRSNRGPQWESYTAPPLSNGAADSFGLARAKYDVRQFLTPYNGARELVPTLLINGQTGLSDIGSKSVITDAERTRVNALDALKAAIAYNTATTTDVRAIDRDPSLLFKGYGRALLPHGRMQFAWDITGHPGYRTLAYGGRPERALRTAAAMTVNLIDSADKDVEPSAMTLLIDESFRPTVATQAGGPTSALLFPWWTELGQAGVNPPTTTTFPGRLDMGAEWLANKGGTTTDTVSAKAVNLYGIEAQPIISEVSSFYIYTDTPVAAGGDDEYPGAGNPPAEITIKGDPSAGEARPNPDFLGLVIAFQLTNPFETDIPLTDANAAAGSTTGATDPRDSDYYIEFAGRYFKLADFDPASQMLKPVVLHAGETRTFYVLSHPLRDDTSDSMTARWENIDSTLQTTAGPDVVDRFIYHQLGVEKYSASVPDADLIRGSDRMRPVQILPMNDNGSVILSSVDLLPTVAATPGVPAKKSVHLWRTLRSKDEPAGRGLNNRLNDLLADRLRDPDTRTTTSTLDRSFTGNKPVGGTIAGDEGSATPEDNTGYTIVLWADMKRRDRPVEATNVPRGAIPAYCVEARWGTTTLKNVKRTDPTTPSGLDKSNFGRGPSGQVFRSTIDRLAPSPPIAESDSTIIPSLCHRAEKKSSDPIGVNIDSRKYVDLYPEIYLDNNRFEKPQPPANTMVSVLRVTDLLLPLGICPSYDPMIDPEANSGAVVPASENVDDEHKGRITLTEALGIALNYSVPATISGEQDPYAVFVASTTATPVEGIGHPARGALDRGNLVLDRINLAAGAVPDLFVPYEDADASGTFDPTVDHRRFPRIPLAMHVLDVFTTAPAGLAGASVPGLINLNTAPRRVASLLPMLTPTPEAGVWTQWLTDALGTAPPTTGVPMPTTDWDITSAWLAYRDRTITVDRKGRPVRFDDTNGVASLFDSANWDGRRLTNTIPGLRQTPGFASRGEVLAAYDRAGTAMPYETRVPLEDQVDYLGRDHATRGDPTSPPIVSGYLGTNTSSYKDSSTVPALEKTDAIPNNYAEKLIVASGVMNSITTRSDVFAVWFVVHGYQKSDTEGLHPQFQNDPAPPDPLVPSIAKRFLMVVDRSNVTRLGQKPRVLLFTEVPMTNSQANQ